MSVEYQHPLYRKWLPEWQKMRRVMEGEEAVKAARQLYLPVPSGMVKDAIFPRNTSKSQGGLRFNTYEDYVTRASFYDATARTVEALMGLIATKTPMIKQARGYTASEPVTVERKPVDALARWALLEALTVSRAGFLIDAPPARTGVPKPPPYVATYPAENITNWRTGIDEEGLEYLSLVCLVEAESSYEEGDPFEPKTSAIFRVLRCGDAWEAFDGGPSEVELQAFPPDTKPERMDLAAVNGLSSADREQRRIYWQEEWEEAKRTGGTETQEKKFVLRRRVFPRDHAAKLLDHIPFVLSNGANEGIDPSKPVLLGVANLALSHFRNSADYEHGMHYTALPTAWAAGFRLADGADLEIGSAVAWTSDDPAAKCGFLEFSGAGLGSIEKALDRKERMMAVLGARLLDKQKRGVETAESMTIRQEGDRSVASLVAFETSKAMRAVLRELLLWQGDGNAEDVVFNFNHDLDVTKLSSEEIRTLMLAWQAGAMSWETFFENMRRGGVYGDDADMNVERERIKNGLLPSEIHVDDGDSSDDGDPSDEDTKQKEDGSTKIDRKAKRD